MQGETYRFADFYHAAINDIKCGIKMRVPSYVIVREIEKNKQTNK